MKNKLSLVTLFLILLVFATLYRKTGKEIPKENVEKPIQQSIVTPTIQPQEIIDNPVQEKELTLTDKIIAIAETQKGTPYKAGGTTKNGFDCSGLVMTSFKKEGVLLPRASYQMATKGKEIDLKDVKRGDLVFFKTNAQKPNKISHVGLVTSVDNGVVSFIHSTTKKGVIISSIDEEYYKKSFCKAKRVL